MYLLGHLLNLFEAYSHLAMANPQMITQNYPLLHTQLHHTSWLKRTHTQVLLLLQIRSQVLDIEDIKVFR
jgi:hypothetical protein